MNNEKMIFNIAPGTNEVIIREGAAPKALDEQLNAIKAIAPDIAIFEVSPRSPPPCTVPGGGHNIATMEDLKTRLDALVLQYNVTQF